MGLFGSKFELTEQQTKKLNSLLPETLKREDFTKKDFESLTGKMQTRIYDLENQNFQNKVGYQKLKGFDPL